MSKIVILGAKGMLGTELAHAFSSHQVFAWDFDDLDITDKEDTQKKLKEVQPDIIINAVAYNNVDRAEEEIDKADLLNGYAVGFLAKTAKDLNAIFVHYSTDYIFDGACREGYKEDDDPNPISAYGTSKLLGEREIKKYTDKFYIIRLSKLFGKIGTGKEVKRSFVDTMLKLSEKNNKLEVVDAELSSPTYAPDLADQTMYILENDLPFGIYHGSNNGACTWYEFALEIFKQKNKKIEIKPISSDRFMRLAKRPDYSILINTKLPKTRNWQDALSEYLKQV